MLSVFLSRVPAVTGLFFRLVCLRVNITAVGKVISYDPDSEEGDIRVDHEDDVIPFYSDSFKDPALKARLNEGDRVQFDVVGGLTGLMCTEIELLESK